jgi:hypothetical protein
LDAVDTDGSDKNPKESKGKAYIFAILMFVCSVGKVRVHGSVTRTDIDPFFRLNAMSSICGSAAAPLPELVLNSWQPFTIRP